jgi:hypothetical protein
LGNNSKTVNKNRILTWGKNDQHSKMEPPKDDSGQVWFKLAQWFQRRRFLKKFTDGHQVMAIAHMTLWVR